MIDESSLKAIIVLLMTRQTRNEDIRDLTFDKILLMKSQIAIFFIVFLRNSIYICILFSGGQIKRIIILLTFNNAYL